MLEEGGEVGGKMEEREEDCKEDDGGPHHDRLVLVG
jgi:hypothetical protein